MTLEEKNAVSTAMLWSCSAAEMLMAEWIRENIRGELSGESKMLVSGMEKGVKMAKFYYGQFTENIATAIFDGNKEMGVFDDMQKNAATMARITCTILNLCNNGYPIENIEDSLNRILANEKAPELLISKETIQRFNVR